MERTRGPAHPLSPPLFSRGRSPSQLPLPCSGTRPQPCVPGPAGCCLPAAWGPGLDWPPHLPPPPQSPCQWVGQSVSIFLICFLIKRKRAEGGVEDWQGQEPPVPPGGMVLTLHVGRPLRTGGAAWVLGGSRIRLLPLASPRTGRTSGRPGNGLHPPPIRNNFRLPRSRLPPRSWEDAGYDFPYLAEIPFKH